MMVTFLFAKISTFAKNSLSVHTNLFVLIAQILSSIHDPIDPIKSPLFGIFFTVFSINMCHFSLVNLYPLLINMTQTFYYIVALLNHFDKLDLFIEFYYYKMIDLLTHGDIETNPGPPSLFRFMHWNCNSIPAHEFERIPILEAYAAQENLNLIAITESALKDSMLDEKIEINGYSILRNNLPINDRCGGVVLYYKNDISVKNRVDLSIPNTIVAEISILRKKIFFIVSYRKPSQTQIEFTQYCEQLDNIINKISTENPFMTILTGDYNAKHNSWYTEDNTDKYGTAIHELFAKHNILQTVNQPTNITSRTQHCIDLVATDQPNIIIKNEVAPSLHTNCSHQVNLVKLDLKCPPPPPFKRVVWHYARANTNSLLECLHQFDWRHQLSLKADNPLDQVNLLDETLLNAASNFIPNNEKTFVPRDPPWLSNNCKTLYKKYHRKYTRFVKRGFRPDDKQQVDNLRNEYTLLVTKEKDLYLKKLGSEVSDPRNRGKKYWTCLKRLLNKNKASVIPPMLDNGIFINDIKIKCNMFNSYFQNQCTIVETSSILPSFVKKTLLSLDKISFTQNQITTLIRKIQPKKSHGHDGISASLLKLCDASLALPLHIIFTNCIEKGVFPTKWKKANVSPIYKKKNEKNIVSNYRPISLLPLCGKIFEKLIYDNLHSYVYQNKFISDKQSGYKRGDSTIKQLISITNEIHKTFDEGKELRAVFLDISRAFDRVWHSGLLFKLRQIGIEGQALNIIKDFLKDREQRVTLDGQSSDWVPITAGVPQGSILGPLLFLIYINDITEVVTSDIRIFADDTFIFRTADRDSTTQLNNDLEQITDWAWKWKMLFNPDISKQAVEVIFSNKKTPSSHESLIFNGIPVKLVQETKHLGMILDKKLSFVSHLEEKVAKSNQGLGIMIQLKKWVSHKVLEVVFKLYVRPHLDYGDVLYHSCNPQKNSTFELSNHSTLLKKVENVQYNAAKIVTGAWQGSSMEKLYKILGWESLNNRRIFRKLTILHESILNKHPPYLYELISSNQYAENSRLANQLKLKEIPCKRLNYPKQFLPATISDWNHLDINTKSSKSKPIFKRKLLNQIRPKKSPYFGLFSNAKVRYLTMLRLGLSPLNGHKHNYNFQNISEYCIVCGCPETTEHYLLTCKSYKLSRTTMVSAISTILNKDLSTLPRRQMVSILLYGSEDMTYVQNSQILKEVTKFITKSKRLDAI